MADGRRFEDDTIRIPKPEFDHGAVLQSETGEVFQIVARRFTMNGDGSGSTGCGTSKLATTTGGGDGTISGTNG